MNKVRFATDFCGERGIRTHDEFPHTCFQDRRLKPLGHLSTKPTSDIIASYARFVNANYLLLTKMTCVISILTAC